jgi:hypothetical protein
MAHPEPEERIAQALHAQVMELGKQIQEYTLSADKYFGLATTVIVATLTLTVSNNYPAVVIALPFALGGLLLYVMQLFTERAARAGMRRAFEEQLRARYSYYFAAVEQCLDEAVSQKRWSVIASTVLYTLALGASFFVSMRTAIEVEQDVGNWLPWAVGSSLIAISAAMVIALRELQRAEDQAFASATALLPANSESPEPAV